MKEINNDNVDLTLIKENDLEKTAAFTDLMSRSERRKYKNEKTINDDATVEFKTDDIAMQVSEEKKANMLDEKDLTKEVNVKVVKDKKKKRKETLKEREDRFDEELSKTSKLFELTNQINLNSQTINSKSNKKNNIAMTIILTISILSILAYYIYAIVFTKFQDNELYLLINGITLLAIVLLYCVVIISNKKLSLIVSIINLILITSFITFNVLIYLNII